MKLVYTSKAWIILKISIDFLRLRQVPENKIKEIVDKVFEKTELLKRFPHLGQKEFLCQTKR